MNLKTAIILVLSFCGIGYSTSAQFHVELGLDYSPPTGDFGNSYNTGAGMYIEPKYSLNENIDLGLYLGGNGFVGSDVERVTFEFTTIIPILATSTYRFSTEKITPYAGLGLGIYFTRLIGFTFFDPITGHPERTSDNSSSDFGFAPRAGAYMGRLNLGFAYNIVSDVNFLQFNIGMRIGRRG